MRSLLPRGVWAGTWLFGGNPVFLAVDGAGNAVTWEVQLPEMTEAEVTARLWAALDAADPPRTHPPRLRLEGRATGSGGAT